METLRLWNWEFLRIEEGDLMVLWCGILDDVGEVRIRQSGLGRPEI